MQYMLMIYADEAGWGAMTPDQQSNAMAGYTAFGQALEKAGAWVAGDRLQGSNTATTVRVRDDKREVLDGPYGETKEQFGGFYIVEAKDLDEALEWAGRCPGSHHGTIEVRPMFQSS